MSLRNPIARRTTYGQIQLRVERLEGREVPNATAAPLESTDVVPTVLEGEDVFFSITHTGNSRIDPNTTASPFAGVGSILVTTKNSSYIGTGTVIGPRQILTAAHVVDLNNDGKVDYRDRTTGTYFILNFGENESQRIAVERVDIQPYFTGFNRPAINDDLAILTLAEDVPLGVPIYPIATFDLYANTVVTMVGYGRSGDGVKGYDTDASLTIKRYGQNSIDAFYIQDDKKQPIVNEVFRFDFDGPAGTGIMGGPALPMETQLGQGDSGGPSFISTANGYMIVGVNTFIQGSKAPKFGSTGGGMNVYAYRDFINSVLNPDSSAEEDKGPAIVGLPSVPVLGPVSGLPVKKGIGVGAKKVSAEFAMESSEGSLAARTFGFTVSFSPNLLKSESTTPVETNSELQSATEGSELDRLQFGTELSPMPIAIDAGLLKLVGGEVLSVE